MSAWDTLDSPIPTAATGKFFVQGYVFADPQGQGDAAGVFSGSTWRYSKPPTTGGGLNRMLEQFRDAGIAAGGTSAQTLVSGEDRITITGLTLLFTETSVPDLTGATGPQVRAFLAGVIQNEGSQDGLVADDPDAAHVQVVKDQLSKAEAYSVPSTISTTSFKRLTITPQFFPRVQAYPYVAYGRVPGGAPGGSGSDGGGDGGGVPATSGVRVMKKLKVRSRSGGGTAPPDPTKPARLVSGITARSVDQAQGPLRNIIDGVVLDFYWSDLHTGLGAFSTTVRNTMRTQLDWCANNTGTSGRPLLVRMRPRMGMYAPTWVRTAAGVLTWYTSSGTDGTGPAAPSDPRWKQIPQGVPIWWTPGYVEAARDLISLIAQEFGSHPALAEVVMGWPTTQFAEPCLKQFGCIENVQAAGAAGYTDTIDDGVFAAGWQAHKDLLVPKGIACYTAFNPPGTFTPGATPSYRFGNVERAIRLMETEMSTLGPFAILANNSLSGTPSATSEYGKLYARQRAARAAAPPTPISYQSETLIKHVIDYPAETVRNTIETAVSWGATTLEIPVGCQDLAAAVYPENLVTPAYAGTVNPQFYANAGPLTA